MIVSRSRSGWSRRSPTGPLDLPDRDLDLRQADPLLLTELLRALEPAGVPVMLLHNYPFHRSAGYLAQVFRNVHVDVGLATHGVGSRAGILLAELLELAPFGKVLYSSDAYGLPGLSFLAAVLFRRAVAGSSMVGSPRARGARRMRSGSRACWPRRTRERSYRL